MTLNPKSRFLASTLAKEHADIVSTDRFSAMLEAALVQMQFDEGTSPDPVVAAATHHRLAGARAFVHTFLNLSEVPKETKPLPYQNLKRV